MHDLIFFLKLFAPHRVRLTGGICLSLAASLAGIGLLALSGWFITASALAGLWCADGAALTFNFLVPAAQIRALAIIRTLARYAERLVTHEATFRALSEIRLWFFRKLIPLTPGRLSLLRSGDLLSRLTADIDALDGLYLRLLLPTLVAFVGGFTIILLLYRYSPPIAGITLIALTAASIVIPWYFERLGRSGAERTVVLASEYRSAVIELLQGMADLLAYRAFERYRSQTLAISDRLIEVQRSNNGLAALSSALTLLLSQTAVLAVLLLGNTALEQKRLSGADLAMIVFCVLAAFELTAPLPKAFQMLGRLNKAAGRIRSVAELPPTIAEPEQSLPLPKHFDLTVERVSFRYPDRNDRVLNDIDLAIPQGTKIAVVGPSGCGKTTLLHLLMRYYDPEQGRIALAGRDYRHYSSARLTDTFAVMTQHNHLFAASLKENLLIAKLDADDQELAAALAIAGLGNWLGKLPDGFDTWVGEHGIRVSGGEARRIALARLYLKNTPLLFLDEPTEGLDADTERDVLEALAVFSEGKTVIMTTHRQAGLDLVDRVYEIDGGTLRRKPKTL